MYMVRLNKNPNFGPKPSCFSQGGGGGGGRRAVFQGKEAEAGGEISIGKRREAEAKFISKRRREAEAKNSRIPPLLNKIQRFRKVTHKKISRRLRRRESALTYVKMAIKCFLN